MGTDLGRRTSVTLLIAFASCAAAGTCWAQNVGGGGAPRPPWTSATTFFVVSLAALSVLATVALVPYSAECLSPSESMDEHRRRLKGFGAPGRLTEMLLPNFADGCAPQQLWGRILYACWGGIIALVGWFGLSSEPGQRLHNLLVTALFAAGLPLLFAFLIRFVRGVGRLSQLAAEADRRSPRSPTTAAEESEAAVNERSGGSQPHA